MSESDYTPPSIWTWEPGNGGKFANINRPTAGATHDQQLPIGDHPHQLYSLATPNGVKVTVMFEELLAGDTDAEYDAWLIRIGEGDQFGSGFVEINPNSKIPALLDRSVEPHTRCSNPAAILLYLAEKFGAFLPTGLQARTECMNWLFWQMGSAPYLGGGFGHFYAYAPSRSSTAIDRFAMETKRQLDVLDKNLAEHEFMAGGELLHCRHGDLALVRPARPGRLYEAAEFLQVDDYTHVGRWARTIDDRPAVTRGRMVNRPFGEPSMQLHERHDPSDFELRTQDKLGAGEEP
jgi:GST-like protein